MTVTNAAPAPARAEADAAAGAILATVRLPAPPERVWRALASGEITDWWVRPGVFDTREWTGDVRVGGAWRAAGVGRGRPYVLEGTFTEVDPARTLAHTWHAGGAPAAATTVTYRLEPVDDGHGEGTNLTLRHAGFTSPELCQGTAAGWQTSLDRLAAILTAEHG